MATYIDDYCSCSDENEGLTSITCIRKDTEEHKAGDILLFHVLVAVNGRFDCVSIKSHNGSWSELNFKDKHYNQERGHYDYWKG